MNGRGSAFNERAGFLVGWNLWMYAMVLMSEVGVQAATSLSYAIGAPWIAESKWSMALASLIILGGLTALSTIGLGAGKWLHSAGGFTMVVIFAAHDRADRRWDGRAARSL